MASAIAAILTVSVITTVMAGQANALQLTRGGLNLVIHPGGVQQNANGGSANGASGGSANGGNFCVFKCHT